MINTRFRHHSDNMSTLISRIKFGGMHWFIKLHQYTYTGEKKKEKEEICSSNWRKMRISTNNGGSIVAFQLDASSEEKSTHLNQVLVLWYQKKKRRRRRRKAIFNWTNAEEIQKKKKWVSFGKRKEEKFPKNRYSAKAQINTTKRIDLWW